MKKSITFAASALALALVSGCSAIPETSETDVNNSDTSAALESKTVFESVMFADSNYLFDLNSCNLYSRPEELRTNADGEFIKAQFTLTGFSDGIMGGRTIIDVEEYEKITAEEAFESVEMPIKAANKAFGDEIDVPVTYMAYYDDVTCSKYFIYSSQDDYFVVSENETEPVRYDDCRAVLGRYIVLCDKKASDDDILTVLTNGTLSENKQIFYIGTQNFELSEYIDVQTFADEAVTDGRYVIKDSEQLSQLLEETKFPNNVLSVLDNILNDRNTAVVICSADIPMGDNLQIKLDENNRILLSSESTGAGYAVIGVTAEAAKGICLN